MAKRRLWASRARLPTRTTWAPNSASSCGLILLDKLIRYQRAAGTARLVATVLTENRRMRELARALGFSEHAQPGDAGTLALALDLQRG